MSRYDNTLSPDIEGRRAKGSLIYNIPPESQDYYYLISTMGDRFDVLAQEYYGSAEYWYIIAAANPNLKRDTLSIEPGVQIRIPLPLGKVLTSLNSGNKR